METEVVVDDASTYEVGEDVTTEVVEVVVSGSTHGSGVSVSHVIGHFYWLSNVFHSPDQANNQRACCLKLMCLTDVISSAVSVTFKHFIDHS